MMQLRRLLAPSIVITNGYRPRKPRIGSRVRTYNHNAHKVGAGTVVELIANQPSPITPGYATEITVRWQDVHGAVHVGWLARNTPMDYRVPANTYRPLYYGDGGDERLHAWDVMRAAIMFESGWDAVAFLQRFGSERLPVLHAVIRELGGVIPKSDNPEVSIIRALQLITQRKITMKKNKSSSTKKNTAKKATKKSAVKKGAKKTTVKKVRGLNAHGIPKRNKTPEQAAQSLAMTSAERLLASKAKFSTKTRAQLALMAKGKGLKVRAIEAVRDEVSDIIIGARDKKPKFAAELTKCNRLVGRTIGKVQAI